MDPDLTIVLLGKTGVGKSASGNTILGRYAFESRLSFDSVTTQRSEHTENVFGKQISVVDTPGILGAEEDVEIWCLEVLDSRRHCLFLVVIKVDRFTEEDQKAVRACIRVLGARGLEKSYVLFTKGDILNQTLKDFIYEDEEAALPEIITENFAGRYHLFNNEDRGKEQVRKLLVKSDSLTTTGVSRDSVRPEDRRIVLLGRPGVGKSASGNTILRSQRFATNCDFESVSIECAAASEMVEGCRVTVVDSPGFTDDMLSAEKLHGEIMRTLAKAEPGPHAFVFVVKIGRISEQDAKLFELLSELFDSEALKYAMVLFTHGNGLGDQSLDEKIQTNRCMSDLVRKCGGRYCVFDNSRRGGRRQGRDLLDKIDQMFEANRRQHYSSEMFQTADQTVEDTGWNCLQCCCCCLPGGRPGSPTERTRLLEPG